MKPLVILGTTLLVANVAVAAPESDTHTKTVDSAGTAVTTDVTDNTSKGLLGGSKTVHDAKVVRDPQGLGNKTTESVHQEVAVDRNGNPSGETNTVDAAGTARDTTTSKTTSKHWLDNGTTTTTKHTEAVDPKGLGNKHTAEVEETVERNADGSLAKHTATKKVDGTTVSEKTTEVK